MRAGVKLTAVSSHTKWSRYGRRLARFIQLVTRTTILKKSFTHRGYAHRSPPRRFQRPRLTTALSSCSCSCSCHVYHVARLLHDGDIGVAPQRSEQPMCTVQPPFSWHLQTGSRLATSACAAARLVQHGCVLLLVHAHRIAAIPLSFLSLPRYLQTLDPHAGHGRLHITDRVSLVPLTFFGGEQS